MNFLRRSVNMVVTGIADASTVAQEVVAVEHKRHLDFEDFDDLVEADGEQAAECWAKPVDPVVAWEMVSSNCCAE